jgi:hypothetical protein
MERKAKHYTDQYYPPTPVKSTLFWRKNIPYQIWRFFILNYKIIRIVVRGHS